jgi:hypothetical protein
VIDQLRLHRRAVLVVGGLLVGLVAFLAVIAVAVRLTSPASTRTRGAVHATATSSDSIAPPQVPATIAPAPQASDVARWNAMPSIAPVLSAPYPAIANVATEDPDAFARGFVSELLSRDYRVGARDQLLAWAQYENAPLRSPNYPRVDWPKVLVDSLTDLTWDSATDTPVPADGAWLALRSEHGRQSVSNIKIALDPQWEQQIASGYQPPDPLATVRDVSATVTQSTAVGSSTTTTTYSISLDVQLGTSPHGGYGVAATNNYVIRKVG